MRYLAPEDAAIQEALQRKDSVVLLPAEELVVRVCQFNRQYESMVDQTLVQKWREVECQLRRDIADSAAISPEVKSVAQQAVLDETSAKALLLRYPRVAKRLTGPTPVLMLMETFGSEKVEVMIEALRGLEAIMKRLSTLAETTRRGYFVYTPKTPSTMTMRDYAQASGDRLWFGLSVHPELQEEIWSFFSDHNDPQFWETIVDSKLFESPSSRVDISFYIGGESGEPYRYERTDKVRYLVVSVPGDSGSYRFHI